MFDPAMADYGVSERIFELSLQPFIRPGAPNFDHSYACAVWDASARVDLAKRAIARPADRSVCVYDQNWPIMGFVRDSIPCQNLEKFYDNQ